MGTVIGKISAETPKYQVLAKGTDYEIREYEASIAAQVTYDPTQMKRGRDGGFMILAGYIGAVGKPNNVKPQKEQQEGEKIAMTAPVITQESSPPTSEPIAMTAPVLTEEASEPGDDAKKMVTMQFILPSSYTGENVPRPNDSRVSIKEMPKRKYGVVTFSGVTDEGVVKNKVEKLRKSLEEDGYRVAGDYVLARYNPPWTLPFLRTNEIMLPVE
ncbi:heme-binding-like protein At3g10130, chloroplastic [Cryptomeria japonica]|uniref:heme-binding-like protein At3g10130, chloroplastic n=1 Tax=Cryptomeria japonica TaxID=3369 RepID=UPI0025AD2466|nr:heme-binding-like protein At3g10130, chloroplastic [Cryptomeria japonica]